MSEIRILVSRHSAFYSPLIATIGGGFLSMEGLTATYGVLRPGQTSREMIRSGQADVIQSAVSSNWVATEKGQTDLPVHFAQINCRDGFFLIGRHPQFEWKALEHSRLLADHATQPLAMLRYAALHNSVDWERVHRIDAGSPERIEAAFRSGTGDFVHLQGPAAQLLEQDGEGHVVASVGASMPKVAFSSLTASHEFVAGETGRAFMRAYGAARKWVRQADFREVAAKEISFFPDVPVEVLAAAVARYQSLGCWDGELTIAHDLYEQALNVFESAGLITQRYAYETTYIVTPADRA